MFCAAPAWFFALAAVFLSRLLALIRHENGFFKELVFHTAAREPSKGIASPRVKRH